MQYKFDILNLEPGDILLSRGDGLQAKIISNMTKGSFSHAMLYVGGTVIHADGAGVYSKNPQRIYSKKKDGLAVYRLKEKPTKELIEEICKKARSEVGKLYDLKGAISSISNGTDKSAEHKQFCSKLVALAFQAGGIIFEKSIDKMTPNDFCQSNLLELKDHVIPMSEYDQIFAQSPDYNLELQIETFEWLSKARDIAFKKRKRIIGSISNVFEYLIDYPEDDDTFCKLIDESRYYEFANIDKEINPDRYDLLLFKEHLSSIDNDKKKKFLLNEQIGLGDEIRSKRDNYLWSILLLAEKDIKFFRKNHDLAKNLYINATTRAHVLNLINEYYKFVSKIDSNISS